MMTLECLLEGDEKVRLDRYLAEYAALMTRSRLKNSLKSVRVNGKEVKLSFPVGSGDRIDIDYEEWTEPSYEAEELPLEILFENESVIVLNKARGVVVHPAAGNHSGTLVQGLMYHIQGLSDRFSSEPVRPGIVHRLDKETSGVLIAAKTPEALEYLSAQFRNKEVRKTYLALARGTLTPKEGTVNTLLRRDPGNRKKFTWSRESGKAATTNYRVLRQFDDAALVVLKPETGRTHQLRVHLLSLGHPILGDRVYSRKSDPRTKDLMLHAYTLEIRLPGSEEVSLFRAPVPADFKRTIRLLAGRKD